MFCSKTLDMHCKFLNCGYMSTYFLAHPDCSMSPESTIVMSVKQKALICLGEVDFHYNKTRLLQLGFSTSTSEKTMTILPWKTTSRFRQAIKYMVVVMSDRMFPMDTFPMTVKFGVLRVLYIIKSCPTSLRLVNIGKIRHTSI